MSEAIGRDAAWQAELDRDRKLIWKLVKELERTVTSLGRCLTDPLNPCWDNRPMDTLGRHWAGGDACSYCTGRSVLAEVRQP